MGRGTRDRNHHSAAPRTGAAAGSRRRSERELERIAALALTALEQGPSGHALALVWSSEPGSHRSITLGPFDDLATLLTDTLFSVPPVLVHVRAYVAALAVRMPIDDTGDAPANVNIVAADAAGNDWSVDSAGAAAGGQHELWFSCVRPALAYNAAKQGRRSPRSAFRLPSTVCLQVDGAERAWPVV